jgi:hypothetical protein
VLPLPRLAVATSLTATLAATLATASFALAAPASADVTGSTAIDDVVLFDHCVQHPISYDLQVGPLTAPWRVEFQVFDPQGNTSEGTVLNSAAGAATSGTFTHTFCGSEPTGTYTVRGTVRYAPVNLEVPLTTTSFEVRPAATRTSVTKTKVLGRGHFRVHARVREQDERGLARAEGVVVRFERLVDGRWKKVRGTSLSSIHGRVAATLRGRPGSKIRAVVPARNNYAASRSKPVRL